MAYRLSKRLEQDNYRTGHSDPNSVDLSKIATVFIVFGLLGLLTAWIYSMETEAVTNASLKPSGNTYAAELGPITVKKHNEVYSLSVQADLKSQSWSFVEGEVLDAQKEYLFAFGQELSSYSGRDSDGAWSEVNNTYSMNLTFPNPGAYYIRLTAESDTPPDNLYIKVSKKRGSSIPHMWFGIISLVIGIALNEIRNRTIRNILGKFES